MGAKSLTKMRQKSKNCVSVRGNFYKNSKKCLRIIKNVYAHPENLLLSFRYTLEPIYVYM